MYEYPVQNDEETGVGSYSGAQETGVLFLDAHGYCHCVNHSAKSFINHLTGGEYSKYLVKESNAAGFNLHNYLCPEDKNNFQEHLEKCAGSDDTVKTIMNFRLAGGTMQRIEMTSFPDCKDLGHSGFLTVLNDVSLYHDLKDVFNRLEELNLVGKIAGSVAHEVRNPLTVVRGHLQLLGWDKTLTKYYEQLETMIMEIDRAVEILSELLYMSKPSKPKMERQNINDILNKLFQLLNAEALVNLHEVTYELHEVPDVMVDKKRFRQVVLNLVNNGFQAMENHSKIIIRTYAKDGKVYFSVKDHGKGIPPEVLKKLGTPFMTTKANGTGLGLASCYSIIAEHNAKIEVDTGPQGTTFTIIFDEAV